MKGVRIAAIMGGMPFGNKSNSLKARKLLLRLQVVIRFSKRQLKLDKVEALIVDELTMLTSASLKI